MKKFEQEYVLNNEAIDQISEVITGKLAKYGVRKEDIILLRLEMEDALMGLIKQSGESITGTLVVAKKFGTPSISFKYSGEKYNPKKNLDDYVDEFAQSIVSNAGFAPEWSYRNKTNIISISGSSEGNATFIRMVASIIAGIILGLLGGVIPSNITGVVGKYVFNPITSLFMNILNSFVGFLVFFSVVAGICSVGSTKEFNKIGLYSIRRMARWTLCITVIGVLVLIPFFQLHTGANSATGQTETVIKLIISVFPANPIAPFAENNMLQILVLALFVGIGILLLGERVEGIKTIIIQTNSLIMKIVNCICKFLPIYIFTSLTVLLWENGANVFLSIWRPFIIFVVMGVVLLIVKLILVYMKLHISPLKMLSKVKGPMLIGFATSSTAAALGEAMEVNEKKLGISERLDRFATPMSSIFYRYQHSCFYMIIMLYTAELKGVNVNIEWYFTLALLCLIAAMISPPVSGGQLIVLGMMMVQLGIPEDALAIAGIMSLFMDFFAVSLRTGTAQMELALQADKVGELDRDVLMS